MGLDISTSYTGICILDENMTIVYIGHINFSKCNGLWEKIDFAKKELDNLLSIYKVDEVVIEESLMSFSSGLSSAATIILLSKFNVLVSYVVRDNVGFDPKFLSAATARKSVGMKLLQKKKCGLSHKEQAFKWCVEGDGPLKDFVFPKVKSGLKFKPFVADMVDSYVIARAGVLDVLNKQQA